MRTCILASYYVSTNVDYIYIHFFIGDSMVVVLPDGWMEGKYIS